MKAVCSYGRVQVKIPAWEGFQSVVFVRILLVLNFPVNNLALNLESVVLIGLK